VKNESLAILLCSESVSLEPSFDYIQIPNPEKYWPFNIIWQQENDLTKIGMHGKKTVVEVYFIIILSQLGEEH